MTEPLHRALGLTDDEAVSIEAILGLVGLLLALWMLIEFILNRSGVYL